MPEMQSMYKLPFRFENFAFDEDGDVKAALVDANGCECSSGKLSLLLDDLPVQKSCIANLKFAQNCLEYPDYLEHERPYHLHSHYGSEGSGRQNLLYVELRDNKGQLIISAGLDYIAHRVATSGMEISKTSVDALRKVVSDMNPYQKIVGATEKKLPENLTLFVVKTRAAIQ